MKAYTWSRGSVTAGLQLKTDEKLGQVVFLGEEGRGRRFEKIALDKRSPAPIKDGRVFETHARKVVLPSKKKGGEEFSFWVLETPTTHNDPEAVLVRINTSWCYTKGTSGSWSTVAGKPETLVSGYGAHGDAGRIGNWDDGLVVVHPGDVLKVRPEGGHKTEPYALWLDNGSPTTATWTNYENLQALEKARATMEEAVSNSESLDIVFADMPAYTWRGGTISKGIAVSDGATGKVVAMGEKGRGRKLAEISLVGIEPTLQDSSYSRALEIIEQAAVVKLDEKKVPQGWGDPRLEPIYGLTKAEKKAGAFLVRISTSGGYTRRGSGQWEVWKGNPTLISEGWGADGNAGRIGSWADGLWVLREGDVLYVRPNGGGIASAVFVEGGGLKTENWNAWKIRDAKSDPKFYVSKGTAPWGHAPELWIGKVVSVQDENRSNTHTGELISVSPLVLNLGWDGRDYCPVTVSYGAWVIIEADKFVRQLEGEALKRRAQLRAEADELRGKAIEILKQSCFGLAEADLREQIRELTREQSFDTKPTEGSYDSLASWIENARRVLGKFDGVANELASLEKRQSSGDILVDFGGGFRRMGASNNGDFWVIAADGSLRDPDEVNYRKRYTSEGTKRWRTIAADELALSWDCGTMRDIVGSSNFTVAKAPVCECTKAQLETVARIEDELGIPRNAFGLHTEVQKVFNRRMEAIKNACERSRVLEGVPDDLDYLMISGEWGQLMSPDYVQGNIGRFINWNGVFDRACENRDAQLIDSQLADDGVLEFLAYEKWGSANLNIRWRELHENESSENFGESEEASTTPADKDSLAALAAHFKRH